MQEYYLGIDIGTGSTKAVAVNKNGKAFAMSQFHYSAFSNKPGFSEQDPETIGQAFKSSIKSIVEKTGIQPLAISLSSVMHSLMAVDTQGIALTPLITWNDARSAEIAENIRTGNQGEEIYKLTGTPVHSMSPLSKIIWIREHQPGLFEAAYKFISIKEYIWFKLFAAFEVDYSLASATGLFDIKQKVWSTEALKLAGISTDKLSKPLNTDFIRTGLPQHLQKELSLSNNIPFVIGASDGCLANLGSLAILPGTAALTIGTSGAVRRASTEPIYNFEAMTFNYCLDEETLICGGPVNNGGIAVQWLLKHFLNKPNPTDKDYQELFLSIDTVEPGCRGLLFLPYLTGERAPYWDTKSSGNFLGVRMHHTQAHFSRAVLEGICFALKQVLEIVENDNEIEYLHVSGGFVLSETWLQILADITGKKIRLTGIEDASAIGAVYLGMKALGAIKTYPELDLAGIATVCPIQKNCEVYNASFSIFKHLYANLKDPMHRLYAANN